MSTKEQYSNFQQQDSSEHKNAETRPWITETGRGEACRTCRSQDSVGHIPAGDGYVLLCVDCRDNRFNGDRR